MLAVVVVLSVAFLTFAPFRNAVRIAVLLPELMELPIRPLTSVTGSPRRATMHYGEPRPDPMVVYFPADATPDHRHGAVVLSLGIHSEPLDHPDIVRIASAICRLGLVVALPDSAALRASRVSEEEPHRLARAVRQVAALPEVDSSRVGLAGFSAGASMALMAAADPLIADELAFVHAFGGYADAATLLVDVATRTQLDHGVAQPWPAEPGIRADVLGILLASIEPADDAARLQGVLEPIVAADRPPSGPEDAVAAGLEGDALAAYLLFTATDREAAVAALAGASAPLRTRLAAISPLSVVHRLSAPTFVMHGVGDRAIPVSHAFALEEAIPSNALSRVSIFTSFQHEQPGRQGLGAEDLPDVWELFWHLNGLVERVAG